MPTTSGRGRQAPRSQEPRDEPHGDRMYRAVDPEGHRWMFATQVKDVDHSDVKDVDLSTLVPE